jgi:hypothetical protein
MAAHPPAIAGGTDPILYIPIAVRAVAGGTDPIHLHPDCPFAPSQVVLTRSSTSRLPVRDIAGGTDPIHPHPDCPFATSQVVLTRSIYTPIAVRAVAGGTVPIHLHPDCRPRRRRWYCPGPTSVSPWWLSSWVSTTCDSGWVRSPWDKLISNCFVVWHADRTLTAL